MDINTWIDLNKQKIIDIRRWLHKNPEIGFNEFNTVKYLESILSNVGYKVITNDKMKTGFYCDLNPGNKMLAL